MALRDVPLDIVASDEVTAAPVPDNAPAPDNAAVVALTAVGVPTRAPAPSRLAEDIEDEATAEATNPCAARFPVADATSGGAPNADENANENGEDDSAPLPPKFPENATEAFADPAIAATPRNDPDAPVMPAAVLVSFPVPLRTLAQDDAEVAEAVSAPRPTSIAVVAVVAALDAEMESMPSGAAIEELTAEADADRRPTPARVPMMLLEAAAVLNSRPLPLSAAKTVEADEAAAASAPAPASVPTLAEVADAVAPNPFPKSEDQSELNGDELANEPPDVRFPAEELTAAADPENNRPRVAAALDAEDIVRTSAPRPLSVATALPVAAADATAAPLPVSVPDAELTTDAVPPNPLPKSVEKSEVNGPAMI